MISIFEIKPSYTIDLILNIGMQMHIKDVQTLLRAIAYILLIM